MMDARLHQALRYAADHARDEAKRIRASIPEDDGDPEARRCTPDGLCEEDAQEWDKDAALILAHIGERP